MAYEPGGPYSAVTENSVESFILCYERQLAPPTTLEMSNVR